LTLVVPVFNGASFLASSLQQAHAWLAQLDRATELLVVDDGSSDATAAVIGAFAESVRGRPGPTLTLLRNHVNRGKGFSVRRAFMHANGDLIAFTDADLTYPIENVGHLVDALTAGADVAIGNRMHADSRYVVAPSFFGKLFTRHASGRIFNFLVRTLAVRGVLDTQAGLKGFRRDAARQLAPRVQMSRFSFDVELLFVARRLGFRIADCPVQFIYRKEPSTVHFVRDSLAMMRDIVKVRWRDLRGTYSRPPSAAAIASLCVGEQAAAASRAEGRHITFVADDLGVSAGVNAGIARAARAGLVREASLCVTGAAVAEGVALARELGIGVGLHLSFSLGSALSGPIRGLTDREGNFLGERRVLWNCLSRRVDGEGAAREVRAQIARLLELGVRPTHLNGHHHVHCFPVLRDVVFATAAAAGIRWTRLPNEHRAAGWRWHPLRLLTSHLARRCEPLLAAHGMRALPFVGLSLQARGDYAAAFAAVASKLPPGNYEWMLHPREPDAEFARLDRRGAARDDAARAELATLVDADFVSRSRQSGIVPSSFTELAG
jgi:dolichyl-phosphate beta-glucosyltransferase